MRLKSLELHGFKSFAEKTQLHFHEGVTGVVGPNGCGKSNVVDAIRWVLGETSAKALRGGEMADVIFNGTDQRKPLGMAEVILTLTDCEKALGVDFNEVAIKRRVFRDGKSEYFLNSKLCRLKDIHNLFLDTGIGRSAYSIMEQGKIDLLLSSRPEDRRMVFEEAAGVSKFKSQKKEALRKLEYTEANLLRIQDILEEVKRQMGSLQRQANKARRYQTNLESLQTLDLHLCDHRYSAIAAERAELQNSLHSLEKEQSEVDQSKLALESEIQSARQNLHAIEEEISTARDSLNTYQSTLENALRRIEFNEERVEELRHRSQSHQEECTNILTKIQNQEGELQQAREILESTAQAIAHREQAVATAQNNLESLQAERQQLEDQIRRDRSITQSLQEKITRAETESESLTEQHRGISERLALLEEECRTLEQEKERMSAELLQFREQSSAKKAQLESDRQQLERDEKNWAQARTAREEHQAQLGQARQTLSRQQAQLELLSDWLAQGSGYHEGTQAVLCGLDNPDFFRGGLTGVFTDYIEVEADYVAAIEAALEPYLQAILVKDGAMALSMVDTLTAKTLGKATLWPENLWPRHTDQQLETLPDGALKWAIDAVTVRAPAGQHLAQLLQRVVIVDNLEKAIALRETQPDLRLATLRGDFIDAAGTIHGGSTSQSRQSVLQKKAQVKELEVEVAQLQEQVQELTSRENSLEEALAAARENADTTRSRLQQSTLQDSNLDAQITLIEGEIAQIERKLEAQRWEREEMQKRIADGTQRVAGLKKESATHAEELRKIQRALEEATARDLEQTAHLEDCQRELQEKQTDLALARQRAEDLEARQAPMTMRLDELRSLVEARQREIDQSEEKSRALDAEIATLQTQRQEAEISRQQGAENLNQILRKKETQVLHIQEIEQNAVSIGRRLQALQSQIGKEQVQSTQLELRIESLQEHVREKYQLELEHFRRDTYAFKVCFEEQSAKFLRSQRRKDQLDGELAENSTDYNETAEENFPTQLPATAEEVAGALDALEEATGAPDWELVAQLVSELRRKIESMGPVNLDAIEEFRELQERHEFLQGQHDDLTHSKDELHTVIAKINQTTKKMFSETFVQIQANFKKMFGELFGRGAQANLFLTGDEDPLESGIEIIAKPPGKKLQSISLLSGGEKTLTASALLFSIYLVKPSPFCVLDELDAPLDESNIERFLRLLDQFIDQSQFIIITHNKRTMTRADIMYGVTMQEFGVSQLVGVKLKSANTTPELASP